MTSTAPPRPLEAIVRRIPEGRVLTVGALHDALARTHAPDPPDALLRTIAEAAAEPVPPGARAAPYWRVVRDDGSLHDALPGGIAAQARALAAEGVVVLHLGKVPRVTEVTHFAWTPPPLGKSPRVLDAPPARKKR